MFLFEEDTIAFNVACTVSNIFGIDTMTTSIRVCGTYHNSTMDIKQTLFLSQVKLNAKLGLLITAHNNALEILFQWGILRMNAVAMKGMLQMKPVHTSVMVSGYSSKEVSQNALIVLQILMSVSTVLFIIVLEQTVKYVGIQMDLMSVNACEVLKGMKLVKSVLVSLKYLLMFPFSKFKTTVIYTHRH